MSDNVAEVGHAVVTYFAGSGDELITRRRVQITDTRTGNAMSWNAHLLALLVDELLELGSICPCPQHEQAHQQRGQ